MSILSHLLGLDKHPAALTAINTVGNDLLTGASAASPVAAAVIGTLEAVGGKAQSTVAAAEKAEPEILKLSGVLVTVINAVDPNAIKQTDALLTRVLTKYNVTPTQFVADVNAELEQLGSYRPDRVMRV